MGTMFKIPTYWNRELAKLKQMNGQFKTFYLKSNCKSRFEAISKRAKGNCCFLDVTKANFLEVLLGLFIPNILKMIGEANRDAQLGHKMEAERMYCFK